MEKTLIEGGIVVTVDEDNTVYPNGGVLVEDDTIVAVKYLGGKWFETPQASRHHGNLRFPYDPEALALFRL
jgi:hypothetical protein